MRSKKTPKTIIRASALAILAAAILMFSAATSNAQKKDFEPRRALTREELVNTGFMTNADVSDDLDGTDDEYFYKFEAGPGKLIVTLEVEANETNAGAYLDVFAGTRPILSNILAQGIDGGRERVTKSAKLAKEQVIILRVKGIKYGGSGTGTGTYKVIVEGPAVKFPDPR